MTDTDLVFVGVVHPPQDPMPPSVDVGPNDFCDDNLRALNLDGLPLHYNHDTDAPALGTVLKTMTGENGLSKVVVGRVDAQHAKAIENIEMGRWPELSLQHEFTATWPEAGGEIQTRRPIEVSFTEKGNRPGCKIIHTQRWPALSFRTVSPPQISREDSSVASDTVASKKMATPAVVETPTAAVEAPAVEAAAPQAEMTLETLSTKEGVQAQGFTQEQLVEYVASSNAAFVDLGTRFKQIEEENKALKQEKEKIESTQKQDILSKLQEAIEFYKADGLSEADEQAMRDVYGSPKTVEEADKLNRVLSMTLANFHKNNAIIQQQEAELKARREQQKLASTDGAQEYRAMLKNFTGASSGPLAPPNKRFASEALQEAVAAPTPSVPVVKQEPENPFAALAAQFASAPLEPPRMAN
jgi:hypothetical protein